MPRVRPNDFRQLTGVPYGKHATLIPVWARWWKHRDGTVTHVHYARGEIAYVARHDRESATFGWPQEPVR